MIDVEYMDLTDIPDGYHRLMLSEVYEALGMPWPYGDERDAYLPQIVKDGEPLKITTHGYIQTTEES